MGIVEHIGKKMIFLSELEVYAHRGASGYTLENTWNAFYRACEFGVGIELDVQITKDGVIVVYHDDNLKRLSGQNARIADSEYRLLKGLKIGKKLRRRFQNYPIPLAYEVFQWAKEKRVPLNIELKSSFSVHPEGPKILAAMLEEMEGFHLSSFDPLLLQDMKKLLPEIETALIMKKKISFDLLEKMDWIDTIHLHKRLYTSDFLASLHSLKKNVRVYGMRGSEKSLQMIYPGLKGIITDYPDRVTKKLRLASGG